MVKQQEWAVICKLVKSGLSVPQLAKRIGRSTTTIYRLLNKGGPGNQSVNENKIPQRLLKYTNYLDGRINNDVINGKKLFLELKGQGYPGSYSSLNRYLKSQIISSRTHKPSIRFETQPGEQAQVDWGLVGKIEINGRIKRVYCFVYILGFSRIMHVEFVVKQDLQTLELCHIHAFKRLGIPKEIVYDNMKTVVTRREKLPDGSPKIYFHPAFLDFARYYGFEIKPCPPYWPRAKGKVEAGVKYLKNNFMQGMKFGKTFSSLDELNQKVQVWLSEVANKRTHGTTQETPLKRWLQEKPYLQLLNNLIPYTTSSFMVRSSTQDGLVQYKSVFYSIPHKFSRKQLLVREVSENGIPKIEIYCGYKLITTHDKSHEKGKWVLNEEHFKEERVEKKYEVGEKIRKVGKKQDKFPKVIVRELNYYDQLVIRGKLSFSSKKDG